MTEGEAKTKWCPFVRAHSEAGSYNRAGSKQADDGFEDWGHNKCIASACMAWRVVGVRQPDGHHSINPTAANAARLGTQRPGDLPIGVCGLAGGIL